VRANRQKDREDVFMVLATQRGRLDEAYMREWCDRHGTRPVLDEMLKAAAEADLA
jgi:hypothetical protein